MNENYDPNAMSFGVFNNLLNNANSINWGQQANNVVQQLQAQTQQILAEPRNYTRVPQPLDAGNLKPGDAAFWMGNKDFMGVIPAMTDAIGTGVNAWLGMQKLDLAKQQFAFQKDVFAKNWANQVNLTNRALYDREAARAAAASKPIESRQDWTMKYGVK